MKYLSTLFFIIGSMPLFGQSGSFVHIPTDRQGLVLGGVSVSRNHAGDLYNNAAVLSIKDVGTTIYTSFNQWNRNLSTNYQLYCIAGNYRIGGSTVAMGYRQYILPDVQEYNESGNPLKKISPQESAFDVAYSHAIGERFFGSVTMRFVSSDMGTKKASTVAFDFGALYRNGHWQADLEVSNLGGKLKYDSQSYQIPSQIQGGSSYQWLMGKHSLTGNAHLRYQLTPTDYSGLTAHLGAEYIYNRMWIVSVGHHFANEEKTGCPYTAFGVGSSWRYFSIDASYITTSNDSALKNSMQFSLTIKL